MLFMSKVLFLLFMITYFDLCHCRSPRFKRTSSSAYHHKHRPIEIYPVRPYNSPYFVNWDSKNNELKVDLFQSENEQGNLVHLQKQKEHEHPIDEVPPSQQQSNRDQQHQQIHPPIFKTQGKNLQDQKQQSRQSFQQQKMHELPSIYYPILIKELVDTKKEVWDDSNSSNIRSDPVDEIPVLHREKDQIIEKVGQKNWNQQGLLGEIHRVKTSWIEKEEKVKIEEQNRNDKAGRNVQIVLSIPNQKIVPPHQIRYQQQHPRPKTNTANEQRIHSQGLMRKQQFETFQSHQRIRMLQEIERQRVENERRRQERAEKQRLLEIQMKKEMEVRELREVEEMRKIQAEAQKERKEAERRFEEKEKSYRKYLDKLKELEEKRLERERLAVGKQREIRERQMTQLRERLRTEGLKVENEAKAHAEEEKARKEKMRTEGRKLEVDKERLRKEHEADEKTIREDQEKIEAEKIIIETLKKSALSVHQKRNHQKVQVIQDQSPPPAAPVTFQKQQSQQIKVETHENTNEIRFLEILRNLNIQENQEISNSIRMIMAKYEAKRNQILRNLQEKGQVQVQVKNGNIVRPIGFMRPAVAVAANDKNDKKSRLVIMHVYKKLNKNKKDKKNELKSQKLIEKAKNL